MPPITTWLGCCVPPCTCYIRGKLVWITFFLPLVSSSDQSWAFRLGGQLLYLPLSHLTDSTMWVFQEMSVLFSLAHDKSDALDGVWQWSYKFIDLIMISQTSLLSQAPELALRRDKRHPMWLKKWMYGEVLTFYLQAAHRARDCSAVW